MPSAPSPILDSRPLARYKDSIIQVRKRTGSLSFSSSDIHPIAIDFEVVSNLCKKQATKVVFPNPAGADLTVKIELDQSSSTHLRIIDLTGKVVKDASKEFLFENGIYKAKLDIGNLQSGIYFVRVEQSDKVYTKKLVVR